LHLMGTPPIQMASLGMADSLILMVMALVVFGPRRLPQIGRQIGKLMYEFRKASNDFKFQMEEELRSSEDADRRKKEDERLAALAASAPAPKLSAPEAMAGLVPEENTAVAAEMTVPEPVAELAEPSAEQATAEETYPRIMPPSTGEQVPSSRRNSLADLAKVARDNAAAAEALPTAEIAAETAGQVAEGAEATTPDTPREAEQAAHHA